MTAKFAIGFSAVLLGGCWAYTILSIIATVRYRKSTAIDRRITATTSISILKPLAGVEPGLEENLNSYFAQDYLNFELIFAITSENDLATEVVRRLQARYPQVQANVLFTGEPPYPHDKVYKLQRLLEASRNDLIVMSDSDVRVAVDFCSAIVSEFAQRPVDLITCPYKGIGGPAFASRLEALSMNVDFSAGLFTASLLEGTKFAVGPTIAAWRGVLENLGGLQAFKDYLSSEDFMLGQTASQRGFRVSLSPYIVEHRIGSENFAKNFAHRFRWGRTTRRSRPAGYFGQFFTYPAAAALCLPFTGNYWPWLLLMTAILRLASAWTVSQWCLLAPINWLLLPLSDLLTFLFWIGGFFGNTISWRGKTFHLNRDGTVRVAR